MALVGQHQDADGAPARSQRHQQQVPVAEGLRQQLAGLEVVGAVADDERLLGAEDPAEQARWVGREAHLVEAHLVEEPALTHAGGRGGGDQRLQPRLVEEEAAHLHVEELGEPEREGIQVLTQLGQAGDRGGGLEEAGELLDVALGAVGELGVALHEPEVLEAPEAGEEHDGHEEDSREVGRRRGRPGARGEDQEGLGQRAERDPEPPVEPVAPPRRGMEPLHEPLYVEMPVSD